MDNNPNFPNMQAPNIPNTNLRYKTTPKRLGLSCMVQREISMHSLKFISLKKSSKTTNKPGVSKL